MVVVVVVGVVVVVVIVVVAVDAAGDTRYPMPGCLQLLEILEVLEISWNLKFLLEILEISWIFVDVPGKIYNQQYNFLLVK